MFKLTLSDGTSFYGGEDLNDSKWNQIPDIGIKEMEYTLNNKKIIFQGYDAYNHLVERSSFFLSNGRKTGENITKILILAKLNDTVHVFNLFNPTNIYENVLRFGQEYNGKATTGWKKGLKNKCPIYTVQDL